jgi:hypothetical protein
MGVRMNRWLGLAVGVLLVSTAPVAAEELQPLPDLRAWMATYYLDSKPDDISRALAAVDSGKLFADEASLPLLTGFFGEVFRSHPDRIEEWIAPYRGRAGLRVLHEALWRSNTQDGKKALYELSEDVLGDRPRIRLLMRRPAPRIESLEVSGPEDLDVLWGCFYATGSEVPVLRVVAALARAPARESLAAKAREHERVRTILEGYAATADEATRAQLVEILATAGR